MSNEFLEQPVLLRLKTIYDHSQGLPGDFEGSSPYSEALRAFVEQSSEERALEPGEILFTEHDPGDSLYWIDAGVLAIVQGSLHNPHLLTFRHRGQIVGEIALIENITRTATAAAITPTRLKCLKKETFENLLMRVPGVGIEIMRLLSSRLREVKPAEFTSGYYDHLTGALSRQALDGRLAEEIVRARHYGYSFSIVFIDLDHFKDINDTFGHARGDEVLIEFVQRLMADLRATDLFFRYGGDEFVLILQGIDHARGPVLMRRLLNDLDNKPVPGEIPLRISFSAGIATFPDDGLTQDDLLRVADRRLYHSKNSGRRMTTGGLAERGDE